METVFKYPLQARNIEFTPSATSCAVDYDFLLGKHQVHHKKLKERFHHCNEWIDIHGSKETTSILTGSGNREDHFLQSIDGSPVEAMALRLFNPATRLWSLYWTDSVAVTLDPPLTGSFDNHLGVFFGEDHFNGQKIIVQFQYDRSDPDNPVWGQAFSNDQGQSWEWNWFMFFTSVK